MVKRLAAVAVEPGDLLHRLDVRGRRPPRAKRFSMQGWLSDLAGRTKDLIDEVAAADLVVMIAASGENAQAAGLIGEACGARRVMTTALILGSDGDLRRGAGEDAGAASPACHDARDRQRGRVHRGHADGAAGVRSRRSCWNFWIAIRNPDARAATIGFIRSQSLSCPSGDLHAPVRVTRLRTDPGRHSRGRASCRRFPNGTRA